jgi:hypothetical protein
MVFGKTIINLSVPLNAESSDGSGKNISSLRSTLVYIIPGFLFA